MGAEFFHADGQTDMTKPIVVFRNIAKAPKNLISFSLTPSGKSPGNQSIWTLIKKNLLLLAGIQTSTPGMQ